MEGSTSAARGVSLSIPPPSTPSPCKGWRAFSERSGGSEGSPGKGGELSPHSSLSGGSEVQKGREMADGDFGSNTNDDILDIDNLHQQLYAVARQREDLQLLQIELHARIIARAGLMDMQQNYDDQFKEHANAYTKLQEQLHQKDQLIHELEKRIEEKDRELHAVKLDNEEAWAKENLLREQNKELQTYRKERDNSEAERSQHLKQIHDLQEHIEDRERQLIELQEQNRVAEEANMFKDEQLREAQAWINSVQEMDAVKSTTNINLQNELRERTEQYNQLWLACQQQFVEVERLHMHTVQQLQLELANARERIGVGADESRVSQTNSNDTSQFAQNNGNQLEANGSVISSGNSADLSNGNLKNGTTPIQGENAHGVALHPFIIYQQGLPISSPALISQFSSLQQWQNPQALPENPQLPTITPSKNLASEAHVGEADKTNLVSPPHQESLEHNSSQFHDALKLDALPQKTEAEEKTITSSPNHVLESQGSTASENNETSKNNEITENNGSGTAEQKTTVNNGSSIETALLDERSLLACIVRTIPPRGNIRISSTLPNRLGKMLAPLHWHDYKKKFGKLGDFVAGHPELFLIEGDDIQLREGAQEIIAAKTALAKVAAAVKTAFSLSSSTLPAVAVTPMAQSYHQLANGNTNVKDLRKPKSTKDVNGGESRNGTSSVLAAVNSDLSGFGNFSRKGASTGKQQDRRGGVSSNSRK